VVSRRGYQSDRRSNSHRNGVLTQIGSRRIQAASRIPPGKDDECCVPEIYHIEIVGAEAQGSAVLQRLSVRTNSFEGAKERALRLFRRARVPQARSSDVESVRVLNGAGYELFSLSVRD
jgi:hypothetical protein